VWHLRGQCYYCFTNVFNRSLFNRRYLRRWQRWGGMMTWGCSWCQCQMILTSMLLYTLSSIIRRSFVINLIFIFYSLPMVICSMSRFTRPNTSFFLCWKTCYNILLTSQKMEIIFYFVFKKHFYSFNKMYYKLSCTNTFVVCCECTNVPASGFYGV
jgi:hypothetical protein